MKRLAASLIAVFMMSGVASADYVGTGGALTAPGNGTDSSSLLVGLGEGTILDITIELLDLSHDWIGGLDVTLTAPDLSTIDLFILTGGGGGGDSTNVGGDYLFADGGADWWAAAAAGGNLDTIAPGTYEATTGGGTIESFVASYAGGSAAGTWTLTMTDTLGGPGGSISGWTMTITTLAAIPEPASICLIGLAGVGLVIRRRR